MNRQMSVLLLLSVVFALLVGCSAQEKVEETPVVTTRPAIEVFGKVKSDQVVEISFAKSVKVGEMIAKEGDSLAKGQPVMALDLSRLEGKMKALSSSYRSAEMVNNDGSVLLKKAILAQNTANKDLELAQAEFQRQEAMYEAAAISKSDYDKALSALNKSADLNNSSALEVERIKTENEKKARERRSQMDEAQRGIMELGGILTGSEDVQNEMLVSRFDRAVVSDMKVLPGQYVEAGTTLCRITNLDALYVLAEVPEEFIRNVQPGMDVEVAPTANKSQKYRGKVESIWSTSIEKNGETMIPVRIQLEDKKNLKPNYNVDVIFINE